MLDPVSRSPASRPRLTLVAALVAHGAALVTIGACNQILGNESTEAITRDGGTGTGTPDAPNVVPPDAPTPQEAGPVVCGLDSKLCNGSCVSRSSAEFGCGAESCAACDLPFANVVGCGGQGECGLASCEATHFDCDEIPANGCEADLKSTSTCGDCDTSCGVGEFCASDREGFIGCDAITCIGSEQRCDGFCTDTTEDPSHCGGCDAPCEEPQVDVAYAVCYAGRCGTECEGEDQVFCNQLCVTQSDTRCGPHCENCSAYTNMPHVVSAGGCSDSFCLVTCEAGYEDANLAADDGCERGPSNP